jgi:hypothetical protein
MPALNCLLMISFENGLEKDLSSFEMTALSFRADARNLSPAFSFSVGERKVMKHFVR